VKIPLLPDLDLARIAPQPVEYKLAALEMFRLSRPPYRYAPFRKSLSDTLNAQSGFLPAGPRVPFPKIAEIIRAESHTAEECEANLRVAEGLYYHALSDHLLARKHDFFPLPLGSGAKVVFWHPFILTVQDRPVVPFFDPRRSSTQLTLLARRFVFSVMHEHIRMSDPDFAQVRLGIFQFTVPEKGPRWPRLYTDDGVALFKFDELEAMVRETYEIWTEVYTRRTERERKQSG
jgi:hypothetical protein